MSHALARLRHMLKDELFVRSPNGMSPTPRAEQLTRPIRRALDELRHSLDPAQFDPSSATQAFDVAVDNYTAIVLVGLLASRIAKLAPRLTITFRPSGTLDLPALIDRREIDLAIGPIAKQGKRFSRQILLRDEFVVVVRKNHPAFRNGSLSIATFAALPHLDFSSVGYPSDFVDRALAKRRLTRRVALRAPFLSADQILINSDMISIMLRQVAAELVRNRPLDIHPLPHPSPTIETAMIWHCRFESQPAHRWLRDTVSGVCKARPDHSICA
jgi:DNA-binding transcriptional LysR family regulator